MYKLTFAAVLGALLSAGVACDDRDDDFHAHYDREVGHVCSRDCHDHYYDSGKIIVIKGGHRHGPNCGHSWEGKRWVIVKTGRRAAPAHVCTRGCNHHYYDGGKLIVIKKGHRHGHDCGHSWDGNRWILAKVAKAVVRRDRHHVCTRGCNDHYYDGGKLIVIKKGHRHGHECGHSWDGKRWLLAKVARAVVGRDRHHVCTRGCNDHYYDGGKLIVIKKGHRHGRNCGHSWDGKRWLVAKVAKAVVGGGRNHSCTRGCNDHYYDGGKLIVIKKGHRHGNKCGHRWNGKHWTLSIKSKLKRRP